MIPRDGYFNTPVLDALVVDVDYERDTLTVFAPGEVVEVVQITGTSIDAGNTVIFKKRTRR